MEVFVAHSSAQCPPACFVAARLCSCTGELHTEMGNGYKGALGENTASPQVLSPKRRPPTPLLSTSPFWWLNQTVKPLPERRGLMRVLGYGLQRFTLSYSAWRMSRLQDLLYSLRKTSSWSPQPAWLIFTLQKWQWVSLPPIPSFNTGKDNKPPLGQQSSKLKAPWPASGYFHHAVFPVRDQLTGGSLLLPAFSRYLFCLSLSY